MLAIIQTVRILCPGGIPIPFGVTGGTAPYTWSVAGGGAGGTINASTGQYMSPNSIGIDTVRVTDHVAATATYQIAIGTPLMCVAEIIGSQMGLDMTPSNSQIWLWDQKELIPTDSRLYVIVGVNYTKPFGNRPKYDGSGSGLNAIQSVNMLANLSIDILSRGPAARDLKEQVLLALSSPYAEQQMELNSFFIAPISTNFVNISQVEGAAILYRFNISVNLQYFVTLNTAIDYFDTFSTPIVTTEP